MGLQATTWSDIDDDVFDHDGVSCRAESCFKLCEPGVMRGSGRHENGICLLRTMMTTRWCSTDGSKALSIGLGFSFPLSVRSSSGSLVILAAICRALRFTERTAAGDRRQLRADERRLPLVGCGDAALDQSESFPTVSLLCVPCPLYPRKRTFVSKSVMFVQKFDKDPCNFSFASRIGTGQSCVAIGCRIRLPRGQTTISFPSRPGSGGIDLIKVFQYCAN
jgi:hypothetical protein